LNAKIAFADDFKRFLSMFSGFAAYAEEVGKVGSLEQAAAEAEQRLAAATKALADVEGARKNIMSAALVEVEKIKAATRDDANAILVRARYTVVVAQKEAEAIKKAATADADGLIAEARAKLNHLVDATAQAERAHADKIAQLEAVKHEHAQTMDKARHAAETLRGLKTEAEGWRRRLAG
jgi:hypothetical protein